MRTFKIPFDVTSEEKVFKGVLSFRQMGYMFLNILCIGLLFIPIPIFFRIIIFIPLVIFSTLCAFLQIDGVYFDKYLMLYIKYKKRNKKYIYRK
ncbi:PrgI family mobile element protein [Clostridium tyrobutyricum]|jgi:hypothetical protein|uniref:PrgI family mobile element protein n=1 Tax=Clostridium TaxID=1485 RepID=UPI000E88867F|nr:PrgI family protein [Clostridiaceae bacterium]